MNRTTVRRDVAAGAQLAAMSMPQSLGYASIAGMPAVTGLYTLLTPLLGFAAFGSSRYLVVAADSATAAVLAGGLSRFAHAGTARYTELAVLVALSTAALLMLARILKLGFLVDFLSQTVLTGFRTGVGFQVGIAVLGEMLGLQVASHGTVSQLAEVWRGISQVHLESLALSAFVVVGVFTLGRWAPRWPAPLLAVAGSIAASAAFDFSGHGIAILGPVASGLPRIAWPEAHWADVEMVFPVAASCFVMIVTQSAATARIYAQHHRQRLSENMDLVGLSTANALAALTGTFVVNGSPTQTAVVESAGSTGQLAQVSAAAIVAMVLLFFNHPLQYLPRCVLGSIVFIVAIRLTDLRSLAAIRRESPGEWTLAMITVAVVVFVGVEQGIVLAMVMSLLRIVHHSYHPHTAVLVPGIGGLWRLTPAVPGARSEPGLAIYRFGAPLFYANAGRFSDEIRGLAGPDPTTLRWVMVDAGPITNLDYSAARVVRQLHEDLARRNVVLVLAHVQPDLQADLDRHHLTDVIGPSRIFDKLHDAVARYRALE
jgi:high affinity sulfate transporter 1